MSTLITGAGGFIGLNVTERLLAAGGDVVGLAPAPLLPAAARAFGRLPGRLVLERGDVRDSAFLAEVMARHGVRRVLHAAAVTAGPDSDPARATEVLDVNVAGTGAVLLAAAEAGIARAVVLGSGAVYGDASFGEAPVTEDTPPRPASLYAASKLAAERLAVLFRARGLDVVRARLTAIYGAWEHESGVRDTLSPPFQLARAARAGSPAILAAGGARDWTPGPEVADALVRLLEAERTAHDLYLLGCGRTWHLELLCGALAGPFPDWDWRPAGPGEAPTLAYQDDLSRPRRSPPSPARFEAEFGPVFRPPEIGAARYAEWLRGEGAAVLDAPPSGR